MAQVRIGIGYSDASSQSSSEADRHWEFWATKSRESFVHELSTVFYDLSATITAFKSWIPRRAFLRFKYRSTPNLPSLRPKLSKLQFSSNALDRQPGKNSSSFLRFRSGTRTHEPPTTGQSSSFFAGVNEPVIRTSKTLNPLRLPHISRRCNARPRRPRSNSTWPPSECCFRGLPKKASWP